MDAVMDEPTFPGWPHTDHRVGRARMARRSGQGSDGPRAGPAPRTFIRAMQTTKRKQHGMSDRFEGGCLCGTVRFLATGQPGYLRLGDQDGLSLPVRIDAPIGTEKPIPEIVNYRKIAIGMPVVEKMELLLSAEGACRQFPFNRGSGIVFALSM